MLSALRLREILALVVTTVNRVECEGNACVSFSRVRRVCQVTTVHPGKEAPSAQLGYQEIKEMLDLKDNQSALTANSKLNLFPLSFQWIKLYSCVFNREILEKKGTQGCGVCLDQRYRLFSVNDPKIAYRSLLTKNPMHKVSRGGLQDITLLLQSYTIIILNRNMQESCQVSQCPRMTCHLSLRVLQHCHKIDYFMWGNRKEPSFLNLQPK